MSDLSSADQRPETTAGKLADLKRRLELAQQPGSPHAIAKRDAAGLKSPRQRIDTLLDPGSFIEVGALAKSPGDEDNPYTDGVVTGRGTINGRPVCVYAHDKTVFGGSVGEAFGKKVCAVMDLAINTGCPVIGINDSGGARVQDAVTSLAMYSEIARRQYPLSGRSPQISIMLGKCAGGAVYAPVTTDFVVAVEDQSYMFVTGPDVIKHVTGESITMEELGSAREQAKNGNINHIAATEDEAFTYVRDLLEFLPSSCHELPPIINPGMEPELTAQDEALNTLIPDSDNAGYDMHDVLLGIFDDGDVFEVNDCYATNLITAFARIDGRSVGVIANQPLELSGCMDADSADKGARFIRTCDAYGLPLIFVVDTPGYLPGVQQERMGVIHRGAKFGFAVVEASVPILTVVVRKAYGGAYAVMGSKNFGADLNLAWPTARIAVMGAENAVDLLQRRMIEMAGEDGPQVRKQLIEFYNEYVATPYIAAERGYVDAVIEPKDTRLMLRKGLNQMLGKQLREPARKHSITPM